MKKYSRRKYIRIISFFVCLSILLGAAAIVNGVRAVRYRRSAVLSSERAISELCENLDNITVTLQKGLYCNSENMLEEVSSTLNRSASCAKVSLGQLTDEEMITDEVYKFLSQVGDFTSSLVRKAQNGEKLTEEERTAVKKLYNYSLSLSNGLNEIRAGYYDGTVTLEKSLSNVESTSAEDTALFSDSMHDTEQALEDYPTLIYDGPFADSRLEKNAYYIQGQKEITADEAKQAAASYLGTDKSSLRQDSDENSAIGLYCFSAGEKSIAITKKGGFLCYMTNPDYSGAAAISEEEAVRRAKQYLDKIGYKDMKESYYSDYDGVCTVNFAHYENGVIYYADLIKVSVALDTGNIVAIDARSYITNHRDRRLEEEKISLKKAESMLADNLTVLSSSKALIPTDYGNEKLCYEFHCRDKEKQEVLVYINTQTGQEENILLLVYADGGTLTK
ncbi:MAG: PepSY1/2 domain-containing protein [Acutalibacteraceae bacterium]